MSALAAALTAIGSAGVSGINYAATNAMNKRSYIYNRRLAEDAFKRNIELWKMENEYNSPSSQIARLRAAGLNPNMAFGDGAVVSSGNASDAPQLNYAAWNPKAPVFGDFAQTGINAATAASQIIQNLEQNELIRAEVVEKLSQAGLNNQTAQLFANRDVREAARLASDLAEAKTRMDLNASNVRKTNLESDEKEFVVQHLQQDYDMKVATWSADLELSQARKKEVEAKIKREDKLADEMVKNYKKEREYKDALIGLTNAQTDLTKEQKAQVKQLIQNLKETQLEIKNNRILLAKKCNLAQKDIDYYVYNHTHYKSDSSTFSTMGSSSTISGQTPVEPYTDDDRPRRR